MKKDGFSTLELTTSLVSAAVLTMGLGSAVFVSNTALRNGPAVSKDSALPGAPLAMWHEDVQEASNLTYTSNSMTVAVPDRNADGDNETITYQVVGDELRRTENGASVKVIASDLSDATFAIDIENQAAGGPSYSEPTQVVLQSSRTARLAAPANSIDITLPPGTQAGELVLLAIALDGNETDTASVGETGWTLIEKVNRSDDVSQVVWSRVIDGTESATQTISWTASRSGIASAMRLSGVSSTPIYGSADRAGDLNIYELVFGQTPDVPEIPVPATATVVQFVATDAGLQNFRTPGLSDYVNEYTLFSPDTSATMQAGCSLKNIQGSTMSDSGNGYKFWNTGSYVMVTVAIEAGS